MMENRLKYTQKDELIMPEYGRNIQHMIEHAVTIEDRAERTRCARTIIDVMGSMFPFLRDIDGFKHKLWDHLYIMSGCRLDIDYPFEISLPKNNAKPEKIPYNTQKIKYLHYGRWIQQTIKTTAAIPEKDRDPELLRLIANNLKKSYVIWNKDLADDRKVFDDLRELSDGKIDLQPSDMHLVQAPARQFSQKSRVSLTRNPPKKSN